MLRLRWSTLGPRMLVEKWQGQRRQGQKAKGKGKGVHELTAEAWTTAELPLSSGASSSTLGPSSASIAPSIRALTTQSTFLQNTEDPDIFALEATGLKDHEVKGVFSVTGEACAKKI